MLQNSAPSVTQCELQVLLNRLLHLLRPTARRRSLLDELLCGRAAGLLRLLLRDLLHRLLRDRSTRRPRHVQPPHQ